MFVSGTSLLFFIPIAMKVYWSNFHWSSILFSNTDVQCPFRQTSIYNGNLSSCSLNFVLSYPLKSFCTICTSYTYTIIMLHFYWPRFLISMTWLILFTLLEMIHLFFKLLTQKILVPVFSPQLRYHFTKEVYDPSKVSRDSGNSLMKCARLFWYITE